jgi:hypothetical protein
MGRFLSSIISAPFWLALLFLVTSIGAVSWDRMIVGFGKFTLILFRAVDETQQQMQPKPPRSQEEPQ